MVSHIYFDWSGTLVKSDKTRRKTRKKGDCKKLYSDVEIMLKYLCSKGYILGMITNSDKDVSYLTECLLKYKIIQYFKGAIVVASMKGMKKKPSSIIFERALKIDNINPSDALMVGNNFSKDIIGAKKIGIKTAFIDRKHDGPTGKEDIYIKNIIELGLYLK